MVWTQGLWAEEGVLDGREHPKHVEMKHVGAGAWRPEEGQTDRQTPGHRVHPDVGMICQWKLVESPSFPSKPHRGRAQRQISRGRTQRCGKLSANTSRQTHFERRVVGGAEGTEQPVPLPGSVDHSHSPFPVPVHYLVVGTPLSPPPSPRQGQVPAKALRFGQASNIQLSKIRVFFCRKTLQGFPF